MYLHGTKYLSGSVPLLKDHNSNNDFLEVRGRVIGS